MEQQLFTTLRDLSERIERIEQELKLVARIVAVEHKIPDMQYELDIMADLTHKNAQMKDRNDALLEENRQLKVKISSLHGQALTSEEEIRRVRRERNMLRQALIERGTAVQIVDAMLAASFYRDVETGEPTRTPPPFTGGLEAL